MNAGVVAKENIKAGALGALLNTAHLPPPETVLNMKYLGPLEAPVGVSQARRGPRYGRGLWAGVLRGWEVPYRGLLASAPHAFDCAQRYFQVLGCLRLRHTFSLEGLHLFFAGGLWATQHLAFVLCTAQASLCTFD